VERHVLHGLHIRDQVLGQAAARAGDAAGVLVLEELAEDGVVVDAFLVEGVDDDLGGEDGAATRVSWGGEARRLWEQALAYIMNGGMNSTSPVSSNIMTVKETVILDTPARKAQAPTMAKIPGDVPTTSWPSRRPNTAPAPKAGTINPAGTVYDSKSALIRTNVCKPVTYSSIPSSGSSSQP
jgi:hypothetical protein